MVLSHYLEPDFLFSNATPGLNPVWNETAEVFLRAPELAVVCLTVKDKDSFKLSGGRFIGNYALPFNSIKPGTSCSFPFRQCLFYKFERNLGLLCQPNFSLT